MSQQRESIIKQALEAVGRAGGWESVFGFYPSMAAPMRSSGQHPCPFTGMGTTKFRLYKDWASVGAGYHNDLGRISGGIEMVMLLEPDECQGNAGKAAKLILRLLGGTASATPIQISTKVQRLSDDELQKRRHFRDTLTRKSQPAGSHWLYKAYTASRGLPVVQADSLFIATRIYHRDENGVKSTKNALLAAMSRVDGELVTYHRIFLDEKGRGIQGENRKMMLPPPCQQGEINGCSVQLAQPRMSQNGKILALTEGVETGLAVMAAMGLPVWACYSSALLEAVEIPRDVEVVVIFADTDYKTGQGIDSAEVCAKRLRDLGHRVRIVLPVDPPGFNPEGKKGVDWLDVYQAGRHEFVRQVRASLLLDL